MLRHTLALLIATAGGLHVGPGHTAAPAPVPDRAPSPAPTADSDTAIRDLLALAAQKDWPAATAAAAPLGPVATDLVTWLRLRAGDGTLADYQEFMARRADWPGLPYLHRLAEARLTTAPGPEPALAWFGDNDPATARGALALAAAWRETGRRADAAALLRRLWQDGIALGPLPQAEYLAAAGAALDRAAHEARLDALLWERRGPEARQLLPLVGEDWRRLAAARLALQDNAAGVDTLIAAVPPALADHPGLARERVEWRARKGLVAGAVDLLRQHSQSAAALGRPAAWAQRRELLARAVLREGDARRAYELAANHHLPPGAAQADLEFLAGFIALRFNGDAEAALAHFRQLRRIVTTPISVARGEYWQARALQQLGQTDEAAAAMARAAEHQTAYYGLLAAEALGQPLTAGLAAPPPLPADWPAAGFHGKSTAQAAELLYRGGDAVLARRFLLHLAEDRSATELAAMGAQALARGDAHLAVLLGKQAAGRGIILPAVYFPDPGALLPHDLGAMRPLALAIARRESEFRADAVSPAGAKGLMQLMPATAQQMAERLALPDPRAELTTNPALNVRLGVAYLEHLVTEFGPALTLIAAGYNAGPHRARSWIGQLGDPRDPATEVIDWVELVPFAETRTYIMRVAEGAVIYGTRQAPGQAARPVRLTDLLRGKPDG